MAKKLDQNLTFLIPITIPNGTTTAAAAADLGEGNVLVAVIFPATMTGTGITFSTSWDNITFYTPDVGGTDTTLAKQNSKLVPIKDTAFQYLDFCGRYMNIVSSGSEGADRVFNLVVRHRA